MRARLDPQKMPRRTAWNSQDIIAAVQAQNIQVAAGQIGQPPTPSGQVTQYIITTLGRLTSSEQFGDIILRNNGSTLVYLKDVATIKMGAQSYDQTCTLDKRPSVALSVYQLPGSNALEVARAVRERMAQLKANFSPGIDYSIVYDDDAVHFGIDHRKCMRHSSTPSCSSRSSCSFSCKTGVPR